MARIIGGIAASHTPTIGFAYDRNKRDESLEAFQLTRNAPGALYSVAGKGAKNLGWDQSPDTAAQR